uniref:Uncharacterized protein n=1 Tax=Fagus sylvatica TaxID=28930 RepID=A0A2N9GQ08_FAGSY
MKCLGWVSPSHDFSLSISRSPSLSLTDYGPSLSLKPEPTHLHTNRFDHRCLDLISVSDLPPPSSLAELRSASAELPHLAQICLHRAPSPSSDLPPPSCLAELRSDSTRLA